MKWRFSSDFDYKEWNENKVQSKKVNVRIKESEDKSQTGNTRGKPHMTLLLDI